VTASSGNSAECDSALRLERACNAAASGRRAARALAAWTKRFGLTEAEFQLLWRLRPNSQGATNQTALAVALAFSAAQISALVERLRQRSLIAERRTDGDRRRNHWELSASGNALLNEMLGAVQLLRDDPQTVEEPPTSGAGGRRGAAA
jgi:DNA-binding MarR family transcriptional regulator